MSTELSWLLMGLPVAFGLGWLASRLDLRQWQKDSREAPRAYFKGLNLLLNEQQDQAIDAFVEAVQNDPDTSELHFALGQLFRRRGDFDRAVRVHQHLLQRGDLKAEDRLRAQRALAQDYMKAGLFDRAEAAWRTLEQSSHSREARFALLSLYERSQDFARAAEVARELEAAGQGDVGVRKAHYLCELAARAETSQPSPDGTAQALHLLQQAITTAPGSPRPWLALGHVQVNRGDNLAAMNTWEKLRQTHAPHFGLVAQAYARAALAAGRQQEAQAVLETQHAEHPGLETLRALASLAPENTELKRQRLLNHLQAHPQLGVAEELLALYSQEQTPQANNSGAAPAPPAGQEVGLHSAMQAAQAAMQRAAAPLQRYRCEHCGFLAQHYFWQCPGCLSWDSYPPRRVEES
jgi:lipopolysaccharide assembly protein B